MTRYTTTGHAKPWSMQNTRQPDWMREMKHGKVLPMDKPGLMRRVFQAFGGR